MNNFLNNKNLSSPGDSPEEIKKEKKHMTKVFGIFGIAYVFALVFVLGADAFLYAFELSADVSYVIRSIISALHTPLIFLIMFYAFKTIPSAPHPVTDKMTAVKFTGFILVCFFLIIAGSMIGNYVSLLLSKIFNVPPFHIVSEALDDMKTSEIIILAIILAPIFEELVFRKLLIDKLSRYGTWFCIVVSALVFGLYHGNFQQFFYAFGVGSVFAYVYCVYGNILLTIVLHAIINAIGSLVPMLLGIGETVEITTAIMVYMFFYVFAFLLGGFILLTKLRQAEFNMVGGTLVKPFRVLFTNYGFIFAFIISAILFILTFK